MKSSTFFPHRLPHGNEAEQLSDPTLKMNFQGFLQHSASASALLELSLAVERGAPSWGWDTGQRS